MIKNFKILTNSTTKPAENRKLMEEMKSKEKKLHLFYDSMMKKPDFY